MKKIFYIILTAVMLLLLIACGKSAETKWQEQYDLGVRHLSDGNYEEAIIAFTAAIEIDPKCEEAYVALADVYYATGDYESAERVLEEGKRVCGELDEPNVIPLNAYGGTEFTARDLFQPYEEMSEQDRYIVDTIANAALSNNMENLYELLDDYTHENGYLYACTIWNGYKVQVMFSPYSETFDGELIKHINIEMRPENGMGVVASISHSYAVMTEGRDYWSDDYYSSEWASCPCKDWQWNGEVELISSTDYLFCRADGSTKKIVAQYVETGTMKNSLRDGEFIQEDQDGTVARVYGEGRLLSTTVIVNGDEMSVDTDDNSTDGAGLFGGYYGGAERPQHCNDDLYW